MTKISDKTFVVVTALLYAAFVIFISLIHVVWCDEVSPMSEVVASTSLADLYAKVHNFGNPLLWYLLLYLGYHIIHSYVVLKVVNLLACIAAIYIFLTHAPFSRLQKILFVLGFYPLYLYPVFARDYAISMLLIFAFAFLYTERFVKMVPLGIVLLLLANAKAYSLITTIAILLSMIAEFLFCKESRRICHEHMTDAVVGLILIVTGIVFSIFYIIPDHNNVFFSPHLFSIKKLVEALVKSVIFPGETFSSVLGVNSVLFASLVIFCVYIYLFAKPYLFIFFSCSVVGLNLFHYLIFHGDAMRHQGALFLLLITVFWIEAYTPGIALKGIRGSIARHKNSFFIFLLILQICMAYPAIRKEIMKPYSSSKSFGEILKKPQYKDAVLVGEPGFFLESVPYYAGNIIYMPREGEFKKYAAITTDQKADYSLAEVLIAAKGVKAETGKLVLIVMGQKLSFQGPFLIHMNHGRDFTYSRQSLHDFYAHTKRIAVFNKATVENYSVYLLK